MMNYAICQQVTIVDMNNELIREVNYEHGTLDTPNGMAIGSTVITHDLGLKEFEVVYDMRQEPVRSKIIDIEYSLVTSPPAVRVFLEPVRLIVGQHDIGTV